MTTLTDTTQDIIRAFLAVPMTAMPSARIVDDPDTDAWPVLRAYLRGEADAYAGDQVRLHAETADYRSGITLTL